MIEDVNKKTKKKYFPTIGLEIHAEMKTKTKMFCKCKNNPFNSAANTNICPICTGQPGTLPYVNKQACKNVMKIGVAVNGNLADFSEFDRKNYFYPDIPKAYQISQYQHPLVSGGKLNNIKITRIHMEEDTATSIHKSGYSLIDFNRSSVPLMELVTEPVIHNAETAMNFAKEFQLLLKTLNVSDANLEKGEMRIEANISISEKGYFDGDYSKLGIKTEVKNLNSFKIVGQAIEYEITRQIAILEGENNDKLIQETRGWNEQKQKTFSQRIKESADDYRYFPDPDIPKYKFSELPEFSYENLKKELPELPWKKREEYKNLGIKSEDIEFYLQNPIYEKIFINSIQYLNSSEEYKKISNYISSDLVGLEKGKINGNIKNISEKELAEIVKMILINQLSSRGAKDLLLEMYKNGGLAKEIAKKNNLIQQSNQDELKKIIKEIISQNEKQADQYKNGETKLLAYFIGQTMKKTKGTANPNVVSKIINEILND